MGKYGRIRISNSLFLLFSIRKSECALCGLWPVHQCDLRRRHIKMIEINGKYIIQFQTDESNNPNNNSFIYFPRRRRRCRCSHRLRCRQPSSTSPVTVTDGMCVCAVCFSHRTESLKNRWIEMPNGDTQNAHIKYFCQCIVVVLSLPAASPVPLCRSILVRRSWCAIYFMCLMKFGKKARETTAE